MVTNRPPDNRGGQQSQQQSNEPQRRRHEQTYGGRIGERLKDTGRTIVTEQKARACEELETISEVVHEAADRLHERDDHLVAEYVDALADQIERAAEFVRERRPGEIIEMVNDFARRRPEMVLGGAFVLGLAAARFLKASAKPKASQRPGQDSQQRTQHQPFRGGVPQPGGGFETRTSEAGPIPTTPRQSPNAGGTASPGGSPGPGASGAPAHSSQQRLSPGSDGGEAGRGDAEDRGSPGSPGSPGSISKTHFGEPRSPENTP